MIFGLITAAGKSRRMGVPKLSLPFRGRTILEQAIDCLRQAGVSEIIVVVGPHVPQLAPLAERTGAQALLLANQTQEMRQTVEHGLDWIVSRFPVHPADDWLLLLPGDHPTLDAAIVRDLIAARVSGKTIVIPVYQGRRGHPVLLAWKHVDGIRRLPQTSGVNAYLRACPEETLEVDCNRPEVLADLDTWQDYERLIPD
jgi:CTP:molybdopterin cytidylyltransferase MocA